MASPTPRHLETAEPERRLDIVDPPLVSVVIPAYNAEAFIATAIESVVKQTYWNVEVIVVDDGSTDGTAGLVRAMDDPRLRLISGPNEGLPSARNKGVASSHGALIGFLDSDDYWLPRKLEAQVALLLERPEVVAVGSLVRQESISGRILGVVGQHVGRRHLRAARRGALLPFPLSSMVARKQTLDDVGWFDTSLPTAADLELAARLARAGSLACVMEPLGAYRLHNGSMISQQFPMHRAEIRFIQARIEARDRGGDLGWDEFLAAYRPTFRQRWLDQIMRWHRLAGVQLAEGNWAVGVSYGLLALLLGPRYTISRLALKQLRRYQRSRSPRSDGHFLPPG
ncbi:MAG: glycosyltransferase [Actinomycetota bacterium]